jgi:tRNA-binding protein
MSEHETRPDEITFDDFMRVEIRVGRVLAAEPLAGARVPAYTLRIDFGPEIGVKQSSARITVHYQPAELIGRQVLAVMNFPPRRIAGFKSEVLTLGLEDAHGDVVLIAPEREVPLGARLF